MIYTDTMNADRFIQFLQQLIKNSTQKIFLILDNLRVHHSKIIKEWVQENTDKIELFYLPSYSPERNPDEYLNCDLKQGLSDKPSPKNQDKLKENVESSSFMNFHILLSKNLINESLQAAINKG